MRNFSLISIILALAAGALIWQKLIVNSTPERSPEPASYTISPTTTADEQEDSSADGNAGGSGFESDEQQEMADQQTRSHDFMMESFDEKYDKYKESINSQE